MDRVAAARYVYYQRASSQPSAQSMEAIEVGGVVQSAPIIEAPSFNGAVLINYSGHPMSLDKANALVRTVQAAIKT